MVVIEKLNSEDDRSVLTPANPWSLSESGYVTWSSISCGLRPIQSVKTMTWFSLKSGIASTGVLTTAYTPHAVTTSVAMITMKRLRIEYSMIFSIMGLLSNAGNAIGFPE